MTRPTATRPLILGTMARIPGPDALFHIAPTRRAPSFCGQPLAFTARSATLRLPRLALCETCVRIAGSTEAMQADVA